MKFKCNIQPLLEGLDLIIISSNVTKFYQKSCITELNVEENILRVNTEASAIKSEGRFKGVSSGDGEAHIFVDSLLFKNLLKTFDKEIVEFEFFDDHLSVICGKSNFNLPQVVSGSDLELSRPNSDYSGMNSTEVNKHSWEFIKDQQMYAIAMSFIHPVYTNVWVSGSGDVIVGDFDNSIFTHSTQSTLSNTCLLTDTVVNLFTSLPDNAQIIQLDRNYEIRVIRDPYTYLCEFSPKYEDDEGVGSYSSSAILSLFDSSSSSVTVDSTKIAKYISQAELFTTSNDDTINVEVLGDSFKLFNENVNCVIPINEAVDDEDSYRITFKISLFKDFISHMDSDEIYVSPLKQGEEVAGLIARTDSMEAVLAGVEL